jgi:hypothetical protein
MKTGGRQKGTPNRKTAEVAERLAALGCDPLEGLARLAMDPANSPELRGRMFAELAQYLHPKRKATELSGPDGGPIQTEGQTELDVSRLSREERDDLRGLLTRAISRQEDAM